MKDISLHLLEVRTSLRGCYENVNINEFEKAMEEAEEALFHIRCCILWLKESSNASKPHS